MTKLFEWREHAREICARHYRILTIVARFIVALTAFVMINHYIGYMSILNHVYVSVGLACVCALLPINVTVLLATALSVVHLSALSIEAAFAVVLVVFLMFFIYFRFSPRNEHFILLTPISFFLRIPYVMPITVGLLKSPVTMIPVLLGTMLFYFLKGIQKNAALLGDQVAGADASSPFVIAINQFFGDKEMYVVLFAFVVTALVVYIIRRQSADNVWTIAIAAGVITQFVILCTAYVIMGALDKVPMLLIGSIVACIVGFIEKFLFFNVDYTRSERVQFEDDEYYYYVKAIPKIAVSVREKQVKTIAENKNGKTTSDKECESEK